MNVIKIKTLKKIVIVLFMPFCFIGFSQTQLEINNKAAESLKTADKELNSTYKKVLKKYKTDSVFVENLKVAQRIWIKFRDAELELKYPQREKGYYGSVLPLCKSFYLTKLTKKRNETLIEFLKAAEEGDICN